MRSEASIVVKAPFAGTSVPNREGEVFAASIVIEVGGEVTGMLVTADQADRVASELARLAAECRRRTGK